MTEKKLSITFLSDGNQQLQRYSTDAEAIITSDGKVFAVKPDTTHVYVCMLLNLLSVERL